MAKTSFYTPEELSILGLKHYGKNVMISRKCSIYGAENITIGDNVRIDDFVILSISKSLTIGSYVHIACYCSIIGNSEIVLQDYSGLSSRVSLYSSSDNYDGTFMTNPCVPDKYTQVISIPVTIEKHAIIGAGSVILPGAYIEEGVAVGSLSLVRGTRLKAHNIYA